MAAILQLVYVFFGISLLALDIVDRPPYTMVASLILIDHNYLRFDFDFLLSSGFHRHIRPIDSLQLLVQAIPVSEIMKSNLTFQEKSQQTEWNVLIYVCLLID